MSQVDVHSPSPLSHIEEPMWGSELPRNIANLCQEDRLLFRRVDSPTTTKHKRTSTEDDFMDVCESTESPTKRLRKAHDTSPNSNSVQKSNSFEEALSSQSNVLLQLNNTELTKKESEEELKYSFLGNQIRVQTMKLLEEKYKKQIFVIYDNDNHSLFALLVQEINKYLEENSVLPDEITIIAKNILQKLQHNVTIHQYFTMQWSFHSVEQQQEQWPLEDLSMSIHDFMKYYQTAENQGNRTRTNRFLSADYGMSIIKAMKCLHYMTQGAPDAANLSEYYHKKGKEFYSLWDIQEHRIAFATSFIDDFSNYLKNHLVAATDSFSDIINYLETLKKLLSKWVRIATIQEQYINERCDHDAKGFVPFMNSLISFAALHYHFPLCIMEMDPLHASEQNLEQVSSYSIQPIDLPTIQIHPTHSFILIHLQGTDVFIPSWQVVHFQPTVTTSTVNSEVKEDSEANNILKFQIQQGMEILRRQITPELPLESRDFPFPVIPQLPFQQSVQQLKTFLTELQQYSAPYFHGYQLLPIRFTFQQLQELLLRLNSIRKYQQDHRFHRNAAYLRQEYLTILSTLLSFAWKEEQDEQGQGRGMLGVMVVLWKDLQETLQCDAISSFTMLEIRKFVKLKLCHPEKKSHIFTLNKETIETYFHQYCDYLLSLLIKYSYFEQTHITNEVIHAVIQQQQDEQENARSNQEQGIRLGLGKWKVSEYNILDTNFLGNTLDEKNTSTSTIVSGQYLSKETLQRICEIVRMKYSPDNDDLNDILTSICEAHI